MNNKDTGQHKENTTELVNIQKTKPKTPKEKVVEQMDRPFELVDKSERRSPIRQLRSKHCDHNRAYKTDAYPTAGQTWVCVDCGSKTSYPEDLE